MTPIIPYDNARHRTQVIDLWTAVFGYGAPHNDPATAVDKKLENPDGLFFVSEQDTTVTGTVMAGYDGHRGWIYAIAVHPDHRKKGIGSALLLHAEAKLLEAGCLKVNLQILEDNKEVRRFYESNGFSFEPRVSMGKKLY